MPRESKIYEPIIKEIFFSHYVEGKDCLLFSRSEITDAAHKLNIELSQNPGDVVYSYRYRKKLPDEIIVTAPEGMEWVIEGKGRAKYAFILVPFNRIIPNELLAKIKIPDSTPEIISQYSLSDEQALLAKVRYNRLIDIFLGISTYSLQNHLRTTVKDIGQIEIDEIYVGVDSRGCQYVIPVQAKGGTDKLSVVQTSQDIACCEEKFPNLLCRPISVQFMTDDVIAIFELCLQDSSLAIFEEKHYKLVPSAEISAQELKSYSR